MTRFSFIDLTPDQNIGALVANEKRIGVDTEFMREKTFFSQLCLVQIATQGEIVCADPLSLVDESDSDRNTVWQALVAPEWVLHSGRQDIEVIYQTSGLMPPALFDTQIAAAMLGYQPQIGYAGLVSELFDVELAKSHTRADWSKRPLQEEVLKYAAEDVAFLLPAYEKLTERLKTLGRLDWVIQDSAALLDPALYDSDPALAINRLKGARNLRGRERAAAVELSTWREREALRTNRPRQWIMRDNILVDIAISQPADLHALGNIDGLPESTIRRKGDYLLEIIATATHDKSQHQPPPRPSEKQKSLLKRMQQIVARSAENLSISAEILAPKKELSAAMLGERSSRVFGGWREEVIGNALLEVLEAG